MANEMHEAGIPFESMDEDKHHDYQTLFGDHPEGEGIIVDPRSILRMRIEKVEVPWSDLRFETKAQSHRSYDAWVRKLLVIHGVSAKMLKVGVRKAFYCSRLLW